MDRLKGYSEEWTPQMTIHLHSSMDRLKDIVSRFAIRRNVNLHSSMDRLKASKRITPQSEKDIYIPVWID